MYTTAGRLQKETLTLFIATCGHAELESEFHVETEADLIAIWSIWVVANTIDRDCSWVQWVRKQIHFGAFMHSLLQSLCQVLKIEKHKAHMTIFTAYL